MPTDPPAHRSPLDIAKRLAMPAGPLLGILTSWLCMRSGIPRDAALTAGVTAWTALWWVLEPIPIPATSLLPLAMFPLLGVLKPDRVAEAVGNDLILLLMGGFILSKAMERSGAHRRLALGMVHAVGNRGGRRVVLGFMIASAALSMWISNTATVLMLLPVALAVLQQADDRKLAVPLLLGVAYAANIGGIGTPVGTPPNLVFMKAYAEATGNAWSFTRWMMIGVPVVACFVPLTWLWLTRSLKAAQILHVPEVGAWRTEEVRVLIIFAATALLWVTRTDPLGGWVELLSGEGQGAFASHATDASVALLAVIAMFLIPNGKGGRLLDWETAVKVPWGLLLLFAGGIAIGNAFSDSGLSTVLGDSLSGLTKLHLALMIGCICLVVTFMTEITSNTATTNILMPILAAAAAGAGIEPALLMVPAAISASCAFMLPVATAPNAIVFGTDFINTRIMVREGLVLNFIGAAIITTLCLLLL